MHLKDWLAYIEKLHPRSMDLGLERIMQAAIALKLTRFDCPVVTIAGTNGKGSTVAMLDAILRAAGYRVGSYISPHILDYRERIRLNGQFATDEQICVIFEKIEQQRIELGITLSYFEFGTLAALMLFQQAQLDAVILEVGLGGRLDAVNVVESDIAVLTTIAIDHVDYLGETREAIGYEKAGIFRQGKPAVCGEREIPQTVLQHAKQLSVPLYSLNKDFSFVQKDNAWLWENDLLTLPDLPIPNLALQNAACVLQVIFLLQQQLPVKCKAIEQGLQQVFWPGRFQVLPGRIIQIWDVAHNPASAALLAANLERQSCKGKTLMVIAMLTTKDHKGALTALAAVTNDWYLADLTVTSGAPAEALAAALPSLSLDHYQKHASVSAAYQQAMQDANDGDRVVVCGSFHTVAEVMRLNHYSVAEHQQMPREEQ